MKVKGTVDDIPLEMALDTGATISIMSEDTARKNNFELFKSKISIKSVSGDIIKPIGRTKEVEVRINSHRSTLSFVVLNNQELT